MTTKVFDVVMSLETKVNSAGQCHIGPVKQNI